MSDSVDDLQKEIERLQLLQKRKQLEAEQARQSSQVANEDKFVIAKFHGGVATKAILPNMKKYAKQELLKLPDDMKIYSKSEPTKANHKLFDSFESSEYFTSNFFSSSFSTESGVSAEFSLFGAKLGGGYSSSNSSSSGQKTATGASKNKKEMSVVIHEYIPKGSFDLPPSEILLSKAAERRALRINSLKDAFDFFEEFGAYYPVCTYIVGGIFIAEVRASSNSASNLKEFETSASSAISNKVDAKIGFGGFSIGGNYGTSTGSSSENKNKNASSSSEVNVEVKCLNYGPQNVNIEEFRKTLATNKNEWTNIGCHVSKLKPIYEIIEDTDNSDLDTASFYLKVAYIVKNLENNMLDQLKKRFADKKTRFDIDLYLTCLSADMQEMAIEEFASLSQSTSKNELFEQFEKWIRQTYNNAINQNLEVLPKLLDLDLDFKDSSTQINNIYLTSECHFAFILYYTDKLRRLNFDQWHDLLDCLMDLKKRNENKGHYVLVNLDLHPEVQAIEEMCLKIYNNGSQKVLCYFNQDFIEFHNIDDVEKTLTLDGKKFTYYIEENVFSEFLHLEQLKMTNGKLKSIKRDSLKGLNKLRVLDLSYNEISKLEDGCFEHVGNLQDLLLNKNRIQEISETTFKGLDGLTKLCLDYNQVKILPNFASSNLENLVHLTITNNNLATINRLSFAGLFKLNVLNLEYNKISIMETDCFSELQSLTNLDLSNNKLTELNSGTFNGLEKLKRLDLSCNSIRKIDDGAFEPLLDSLEILDFKENKIDLSSIKKFNFKLLNFNN